jgi:hypothetical protein
LPIDRNHHGKRSQNRRQFLRKMGALGLASALPAASLRGSGRAKATTVPPAAVSNRSPLAPNAFYPLPLTSAQGGEIGAGVSTALGLRHSEHLIA